jgi:phosphonate transport system ATP-binding protein
LIRLEQVSHQFANGTRALSDVSLAFSGQDFTVLIGPSGAGKSTLMRVLNGLVRPKSGKVWIGDTEISHAPERIVRLERRRIGMVFQSFNLVKRLTALENVLLGRLGDMPAWRSTLRLYTKADRSLAMNTLERVGMADFAWQRADTLSGGQQQRVGIARALAQRPQLILADEPISALDPKSSEQVMELLRDIQQRDGIAVLTNLHHLDAVREYAGRVIALKQGSVFFDGRVSALTDEITRDLYYGETTDDPSWDTVSNVPMLSADNQAGSPSFLLE